MADGRMDFNQEVEITIGDIMDNSDPPRPTSFEDPPVWVASPNVDLVVSADGLRGIARSRDERGAWNVTATGDGRWGPEVVPIMVTVSGVIAPPDVSVFTMTVGEARARTEGEP